MYEHLPKSAREAKAAGLTHYYTGKPCKRGHITLRIASSEYCLKCNCRSFAQVEKRRKGIKTYITEWEEDNSPYMYYEDDVLCVRGHKAAKEIETGLCTGCINEYVRYRKNQNPILMNLLFRKYERSFRFLLETDDFYSFCRGEED